MLWLKTRVKLHAASITRRGKWVSKTRNNKKLVTKNKWVYIVTTIREIGVRVPVYWYLMQYSIATLIGLVSGAVAEPTGGPEINSLGP